MLECIHNKNVLMLIFFLGRNEKKKKKKKKRGEKRAFIIQGPNQFNWF
jgi:hypothetical protein